MGYIAVHDDKEYKIDINNIVENKFAVELNGKKIEVDLIHSEHSLYSLLINGKSYEVNLNNKNGDCSIHINGEHYHISIVNEKKKSKIKKTGFDDTAGKQVINASMPGKVIKVLIKEGDDVEDGQGLIVLEAMKMENEIEAPRKGKITSILVNEGDTVEGGVKLLIIE